MDILLHAFDVTESYCENRELSSVKMDFLFVDGRRVSASGELTNVFAALMSRKSNSIDRNVTCAADDNSLRFETAVLPQVDHHVQQNGRFPRAEGAFKHVNATFTG